MFYAKSMYRGGEIVCADDEDISYSSYIQDGICCLECNEDVTLKGGSEKRTYFAHHKAIRSSQCVLRVSVNGDSKIWSGFNPEGKSQRRELFQEYFLNMIKTQDKDWDNNIQILKSTISSTTLINIKYNCLDLKGC